MKKLVNILFFLTFFFLLSFKAFAVNPPDFSEPYPIKIQIGSTLDPSMIGFFKHEINSSGTGHFLKDGDLVNMPQGQFHVEDYFVVRGATSVEECRFKGADLGDSLLAATYFLYTLLNINPPVVNEFSKKFYSFYSSIQYCPRAEYLKALLLVNEMLVKDAQTYSKDIEEIINNFYSSSYEDFTTYLEGKDDEIGKIESFINQVDPTLHAKSIHLGKYNEIKDKTSDLTHYDLLLADVLNDAATVVNSAEYISPYENGYPPAVGDYAATVYNNDPEHKSSPMGLVSHVNSDIDVVMLLKNLKGTGFFPSLAYYKMDGTFVLHSYGNPYLNNLKKGLKCDEAANKDLCVLDEEPAAVVSADMDGDLCDDIVVISRKTNGELKGHASLYLGTCKDTDATTGLPIFPFTYKASSGTIPLPTDATRIDVKDSNTDFVIATSNIYGYANTHFIFKITYDNNSKVLDAKRIKVETPIPQQESFSPYQIAAVDLGGKCDAVALTWASYNSEISYYDFINKFTVVRAGENCSYVQALDSYQPSPKGTDEGQPLTNAQLSGITFSKKTDQSPAYIAVGDQQFYDYPLTDAFAYIFPIDEINDSIIIDQSSKTQMVAGDALINYLPVTISKSTSESSRGAVKQLTTDQFGNLGAVLGPVKVWVEPDKTPKCNATCFCANGADVKTSHQTVPFSLGEIPAGKKCPSNDQDCDGFADWVNSCVCEEGYHSVAGFCDNCPPGPNAEEAYLFPGVGKIACMGGEPDASDKKCDVNQDGNGNKCCNPTQISGGNLVGDKCRILKSTTSLFPANDNMSGFVLPKNQGENSNPTGEAKTSLQALPELLQNMKLNSGLKIMPQMELNYLQNFKLDPLSIIEKILPGEMPADSNAYKMDMVPIVPPEQQGHADAKKSSGHKPPSQTDSNSGMHRPRLGKGLVTVLINVSKNETIISTTCGDGKLDDEEECDEGENNSNTGSCLISCKKAYCGDGYVQNNVEQCDDANTIDADNCSNGCLNPNITTVKDASDCWTKIGRDGKPAAGIGGLEDNYNKLVMSLNNRLNELIQKYQLKELENDGVTDKKIKPFYADLFAGELGQVESNCETVSNKLVQPYSMWQLSGMPLDAKNYGERRPGRQDTYNLKLSDGTELSLSSDEFLKNTAVRLVPTMDTGDNLTKDFALFDINEADIVEPSISGSLKGHKLILQDINADKIRSDDLKSLQVNLGTDGEILLRLYISADNIQTDKGSIYKYLTTFKTGLDHGVAYHESLQARKINYDFESVFPVAQEILDSLAKDPNKKITYENFIRELNKKYVWDPSGWNQLTYSFSSGSGEELQPIITVFNLPYYSLGADMSGAGCHCNTSNAFVSVGQAILPWASILGLGIGLKLISRRVKKKHLPMK